MKSEKSFAAVGISLVVLALTIGFGVYYFKNIYFPKFLKEELKLNYKTVDLSLLSKTVTIEEPLYIHTNPEVDDKYRAKQMLVEVSSVGFISKKVDIRKITLTDLELVSVDKDGNVVGTKLELPLNNLTTSLENVFLDTQVDKKELYIQGQVLDQTLSSIVGQYLKDRLNTEIGKVEVALSSLKKWQSIEENSKGMWSVNVDKVVTNCTLFGQNYNIEVYNLTNRFSQMKKPIEFTLKSDLVGIEAAGKLNVPVLQLESWIETKDFNYKLVPGFERYVEFGKFIVKQNNIIESNSARIFGVCIITDLKLNPDTVVEDVFKKMNLETKNTQLNTYRMKKLKNIVSRVDSLRVQYSYDKETGIMIIETDLKPTINMINTQLKEEEAE
ncbi:MAG: hypothetical protein KA493_07280 [Fusobacteriaceae bacterium]|nr:hypothetical protein [Fusobacteriaceae bacterium]